MFYAFNNVMLGTLEDEPYVNTTIPGKVQSYMAVWKPIIGAINGSCTNFIRNNEVGYCVPSCNFELLASIIRNIDEKELRKIGNNSKNVYIVKFSKMLFMERIIKHLGGKNEKYDKKSI